MRLGPRSSERGPFHARRAGAALVREPALRVRPSLPLGRRHASSARDSCPSRPSLPLGRRHASFAQTVLACSETGASVVPWSLCTAARQLSSQAAELALRGMPRPFFRDGRNGIHECHAVTTQRRAVRSDRAALRCAALGVAKAARTVHSEAGASPAERRTRARAKPGGASASAQPGPEGARGRARSTRSRFTWRRGCRGRGCRRSSARGSWCRRACRTRTAGSSR